jgi:hypothetical protein
MKQDHIPSAQRRPPAENHRVVVNLLIPINQRSAEVSPTGPLKFDK